MYIRLDSRLIEVEGRFRSREADTANFVHRENLDRFRKLLAKTTDEAQRQTLLTMLAKEEANVPPPHLALP